VGEINAKNSQHTTPGTSTVIGAPRFRHFNPWNFPDTYSEFWELWKWEIMPAFSWWYSPSNQENEFLLPPSFPAISDNATNCKRDLTITQKLNT